MQTKLVQMVGWFISMQKTGGCPLKKALHSFMTVQGGTSRLERHTAAHKTTNRIVRF